MNQTYDVIIIGAGIMGLSSAWQISQRSHLKLLVIERGAAPGGGSSGASSAVCRHLYSHPELVELARDSINLYRGWQEFLALDTPLASFQQIGALWFGSAEYNWTDDDLARLQRFDVPASLLSNETLKERFPDLEPETANRSHLFEENAGYIDPQDALTDLVSALRKKGVEIQFSSQVEQVTVTADRVTGVTLASGETVSAPIVLNASGPWCNPLLDGLKLGNQWPLKPTRIQMVHLSRPGEIIGPLPVCVDTASGIYFRPHQQHQIIVGSTREEDEREVIADPDRFNQLPDDEFLAVTLHQLQQRVPALSALTSKKQINGYCGLYTVNHADIHPVLGKTPVTGFFVANGFSGHGFKLGPAIGSLMAQCITGETIGGDTEVPIDFLSWYREPLNLENRNVLA